MIMRDRKMPPPRVIPLRHRARIRPPKKVIAVEPMLKMMIFSILIQKTREWKSCL
jgi:hypothetical protein